jgi:hypothetical protein
VADGRAFTPARTELEETLAQDWPRCGGEQLDGADAWIFAGFEDEQVVAWLEVGVHKASAAVRLRDAGVTPRDVLGEHEHDVTLGLAFSRGDLSLARLLAHARGDMTPEQVETYELRLEVVRG